MDLPYNKEDLKDTIGNFRTLSLFFEYNNTDNKPIFTLKDYDHEGCLSLKQIYLSFDDPTEWDFVQTVFGNWRHWQRIINNRMLRPYIDQWREELEIKLRSQAIREMVKQSKNKDSAAKWIAEGSWKGKRGRPSKEEVERERKIAAGIDDELTEHWERVKEEMSATSKPN